MNTGTGQVDTAYPPAQAAAQLVATPVGTLLITTPPGCLQVAEIQGHTPVKATPTEQLGRQGRRCSEVPQDAV